MKIAAIKERAKGEYRTAITPETARLFIKKGHEVYVEKNIGIDSNFTDAEYEAAGAKISPILLEILSDADVICKVQPSPFYDEFNEIDMAKENAIIISMFWPYAEDKYIQRLLSKKLSAIALELVPRITKAQNMDVLSSQSNLAGYRAVIEASYYFNRAFPMMMTAAGTVNPAKILVIGVGVAGLQAIATAKRLGGVVSAYDIRPSTKEQVESLGGKFVYPAEHNNNSEEKSGYASEVGKDFSLIQEQFLLKIISGFDVVITTAQIPGKQAPVMITKEMVASMKTGSVIVDMAASTGGNVEDSFLDKIITKKGVKIIGWSNMATKLSADASKLYAKNMYNFLDYAVKDNKFTFKDDLVEEMMIAQDGQLTNKKFKV